MTGASPVVEAPPPIAATELRGDDRFGFGANWQRFLSRLTQERLQAARESLERHFGSDGLQGRRFLDIGSGSGLFSAAACQLGAEVTSFDYDADSVACTETLRTQSGVGEDRWRIERGSVLDAAYLSGLGTFDVVYAWGVLHHTGDLWTALANACRCVAPGGCLWIAIYNDQGAWSQYWTRIDRGMSAWTDLVDWVGGYPFEVATPDAVFGFVQARGFVLRHLKTCGGGSGCNEFLFHRESQPSAGTAPDRSAERT